MYLVPCVQDDCRRWQTGFGSVAESRNKVRSVVLVLPTAVQATTEGSFLDKVGMAYRINNIYTSVTLPSYPTRETKDQIGIEVFA